MLQGEATVRFLYDGNRIYEQKPQLVEAVDTLGAGDSFAAAFLLSYVENLEKPQNILRRQRNQKRRLLKRPWPQAQPLRLKPVWFRARLDMEKRFSKHLLRGGYRDDKDGKGDCK